MSQMTCTKLNIVYGNNFRLNCVLFNVYLSSDKCSYLYLVFTLIYFSTSQEFSISRINRFFNIFEPFLNASRL